MRRALRRDFLFGGGDDTGDAEVCLFENLADDTQVFSFEGLADVCECEWDLVDGIRVEKRLPRLVEPDKPRS